jgi:hypothetical protein
MSEEIPKSVYYAPPSVFGFFPWLFFRDPAGEKLVESDFFSVRNPMDSIGNAVSRRAELTTWISYLSCPQRRGRSKRVG